jgi:hypothetical protein
MQPERFWLLPAGSLRREPANKGKILQMKMRSDIASAICSARHNYISDGLASSYWEINNGLCEDLAMSVLEALGVDSKSIYEVCGGNFMVDGDETAGVWDWDLLAKHWNIGPSFGLTASQVSDIEFGGHVWITDGTLHYDAECPGGVESFFDLPIFRRYIVMEMRRLGVYCSDVVTQDVRPPPECPVPNAEILECASFG